MVAVAFPVRYPLAFIVLLFAYDWLVDEAFLAYLDGQKLLQGPKKEL